MIWSSTERGGTQGAIRSDRDAAPWDCVDFGVPEADETPMDAAALEAQREEELEAAYRRGYAEGEEAARARVRREVATAVASTRRVLEQVRESRDSWDRALEERMLALSMAVARQIVQRELTGDRESFRSLVAEAVEGFPTDQVLRIRLHPDDLAALADEESGHVPGDEATGGREARWIPDDEIVSGGCVVEGPDRIVDGRVDAALERIFRALSHD